MNIDSILNVAVRSIKSALPSAIYSGKILNIETVYNTITLNNDEISTSERDVEIISDTLTSEEIQASNLLSTDLKLYVIGDKLSDISFYEYIIFNNEKYKIKKKIDQLVGTKTALWTIACRK